MRETELYARILGLPRPWQVTEVVLQQAAGDVEIRVVASDGELRCPQCGAVSPGYDTRERRWRHLDTCQYRTIVVAAVPRVRCATHGVVQLAVPWASPGSHFTAWFEVLAIDWLRQASVAAVARQLRLSWDTVDGIQRRAVARGLARRGPLQPRRIGVDETSFQRRHEYVTVVCDLDTSVVLHVAEEHKATSLGSFYEALGPAGCAALEVVVSDMWRPYIAATKAFVPDAARKQAFDKFHVAQLLGEAVDAVRRAEHRALRQRGVSPLTGTRHWWLRNRRRLTAAVRRAFGPLRRSALQTARAWAIKELGMSLWRFTHRGWAERAWKRWLGWALRCRLEPVRAAARTVRKYLWGILNAIILGVTNARSEAINTRIQALKRRACGYRNRERFRAAIYFHLGGLSLYPAEVLATHSKP